MCFTKGKKKDKKRPSATVDPYSKTLQDVKFATMCKTFVEDLDVLSFALLIEVRDKKTHFKPQLLPVQLI